MKGGNTQARSQEIRWEKMEKVSGIRMLLLELQQESMLYNICHSKDRLCCGTVCDTGSISVSALKRNAEDNIWDIKTLCLYSHTVIWLLYNTGNIESVSLIRCLLQSGAAGMPERQCKYNALHNRSEGKCPPDTVKSHSCETEDHSQRNPLPP